MVVVTPSGMVVVSQSKRARKEAESDADAPEADGWTPLDPAVYPKKLQVVGSSGRSVV